MLIRKNGLEIKSLEERDARALTLFNLMDCLRDLKKQGYFYSHEQVSATNGTYLTMGKEKELLHLSQEWNGRQIEERQITSIWIVFRHIITRETKYLFIGEELFEDEVQTIMWMDDSFSSGFAGGGRITYIKDMPIVFEEILRRCGMILVPGKFYKMDLAELRKRMPDSLFTLLYQHEYRQIQEGQMEIKEDKHWEKSFAWAGEFVPPFCGDQSQKYLEVAIYRREFEQWECNCDEGISCIWEEERTDVYVAWCEESVSEAEPEDDKKISLKKLKGEEEITTYLKTFHSLDRALAAGL